MKSSSQDKVEGTVNEIKGRAKEAYGQATNNPQLRDEGRADRVDGKIQKKVGDVKKVFDR